MKALTCEMCGSTNIIKQDGMFVCQSCGTKYSVEEAKKMMVEGTVDVKGTVKLDTSSELNNLYEIARRAKDTDNSENAARYYDQILVKDPSSWEANFFVVYFKARQCKIGQIGSAADSITNCLPVVLDLVKKQYSREEAKDDASERLVIDDICSKTNDIAFMLYRGATNHYNGIGQSIKEDYTQEYVNWAISSRDIFYTLGDSLDEIFEGKYSTQSCLAWKNGIEVHNDFLYYLRDKDANINLMNKYMSKIKKYNPSYVEPKPETGGCYIATSVYGSYDCPEVWTLRRYRDYRLSETWLGRCFVKTYYAISPTLVKWFGTTSWFKRLWRKTLDKWVLRLQQKGFSSSPYQDREW